MPIRPEMKARYPADWATRSRFVRFVRAGGRCEWFSDGQRCRAVHGQPHPLTGSKVVLTAAHLFDHRPESAGLLNLAAFCQKHHLAYDAPMRRYRRETGVEVKDAVFTAVDPDTGFLIGWWHGTRTVLVRSASERREVGS